MLWRCTHLCWPCTTVHRQGRRFNERTDQEFDVVITRAGPCGRGRRHGSRAARNEDASGRASSTRSRGHGAEAYPEKPIYDIPGVLITTAQDWSILLMTPGSSSLCADLQRQEMQWRPSMGIYYPLGPGRAPDQGKLFEQAVAADADRQRRRLVRVEAPHRDGASRPMKKNRRSTSAARWIAALRQAHPRSWAAAIQGLDWDAQSRRWSPATPIALHRRDQVLR